MKNTRFSDAQIMAILKQAESGVSVTELCREHGMSSAAFYRWRAEFGGMDASLIAEMKAMAEENRRLKRMFADLSMQNDLLKETLGKSSKASSTSGAGRSRRHQQRHQHRARLPCFWDQRSLVSL